MKFHIFDKVEFNFRMEWKWIVLTLQQKPAIRYVWRSEQSSPGTIEMKIYSAVYFKIETDGKLYRFDCIQYSWWWLLELFNV